MRRILRARFLVGRNLREQKRRASFKELLPPCINARGTATLSITNTQSRLTEQNKRSLLALCRHPCLPYLSREEGPHLHGV